MEAGKFTSLREAGRKLALVPAEKRSELLRRYGSMIRGNVERILGANRKDLSAATGLPPALLGRLKLDESKIEILAKGIDAITCAKDPVGEVIERRTLDTGLVLEKVRVPIGVLGVIFESRPDVLPQIISLAVRSANAVLLKGGREAEHSNNVLFEIFVEAVEGVQGLQGGFVQLHHKREIVKEMIASPDAFDLVIPRGSKEMVQAIMKESLVPVLGHAEGVCHIFVERSADLGEALEIVYDAKLNYPSGCNAVETVLVESKVAPDFLSRLGRDLRGIQVKGCDLTRKYVPEAESVEEGDFSVEYGAAVMNVKAVQDLEEAIAHINRFGSHHTDAILSRDERAIERFLSAVDSASVFANCSTRFADGYRFGLGAEVGIGTGRIHARGPVGIEGLLTYKYVLRGSGQIVADYTGSNAKGFLHRDETI